MCGRRRIIVVDMGIGRVGAIEVTAVRTRGLDGLLIHEDEVDGAGGCGYHAGGTNEDDGVYGQPRMLECYDLMPWVESLGYLDDRSDVHIAYL